MTIVINIKFLCSRSTKVEIFNEELEVLLRERACGSIQARWRANKRSWSGILWYTTLCNAFWGLPTKQWKQRDGPWCQVMELTQYVSSYTLRGGRSLKSKSPSLEARTDLSLMQKATECSKKPLDPGRLGGSVD